MVTQENVLQVILVALVSYFLGSIPTAYLIVKARRNVNIFEEGSGNMGGTNVMRALGPVWGVFVALVDMAKGIVAILIARAILPSNEPLSTALGGFVAIIGHNWSLFAWLVTGILRGGKGGATAFGTLIVIAPLQVIAGFLGVAGLILLLTRYMSLAVLIAFSVATVWVLMLIYQQLLPPEYGIYIGLMFALIFVRFRGNIQRLLDGKERRLGDRA